MRTVACPTNVHTFAAVRAGVMQACLMRLQNPGSLAERVTAACIGQQHDAGVRYPVQLVSIGYARPARLEATVLNASTLAGAGSDAARTSSDAAQNTLSATHTFEGPVSAGDERQNNLPCCVSFTFALRNTPHCATGCDCRCCEAANK